ncbi:AraC family transcriptional regulator [Billgrantia kenyensis]|uniref:Helix-turn-helix transcriptional regulator n=1 Tax=Billgrantia kenyensis TaxID=321266 RepID=A0A7V9W4V1_9GAMM|nr:helix-turn-helix domain-containing protein [Halomonas kenyensis]MBA2781081.1 helix-turn-helix transcriptional regulator [Halomonas kenyensis]MCG6663794.1 helix-turn-helix transcriptional regulator [Halomonas kenyensis]
MLRRFTPSAALRSYVQCYWQAQGQEGSELAGRELLHPDGAAGLLFNFGGALERDGNRLGGTCWIDGPKRRTARLAVGETLDLFGVRFLPGMAFPFVSEPLTTLAGGDLTPGDALRRLELEALHERLGERPDLAGRIALLESYILERLQRHDAPQEPALTASLDWLKRHQGQASIATLVGELPFGQRHLERLFQHHVGLSPKRYARLLRVAHSRELIKQSRASVSLTDTALAAGYFDQAHFIHDFKAVTGLTPGGYRQYARHRYGCSYPARAILTLCGPRS